MYQYTSRSGHCRPHPAHLAGLKRAVKPLVADAAETVQRDLGAALLDQDRAQRDFRDRGHLAEIVDVVGLEQNVQRSQA